MPYFQTSLCQVERTYSIGWADLQRFIFYLDSLNNESIDNCALLASEVHPCGSIGTAINTKKWKLQWLCRCHGNLHQCESFCINHGILVTQVFESKFKLPVGVSVVEFVYELLACTGILGFCLSLHAVFDDIEHKPFLFRQHRCVKLLGVCDTHTCKWILSKLFLPFF